MGKKLRKANELIDRLISDLEDERIRVARLTRDLEEEKIISARLAESNKELTGLLEDILIAVKPVKESSSKNKSDAGNDEPATTAEEEAQDFYKNETQNGQALNSEW